MILTVSGFVGACVVVALVLSALFILRRRLLVVTVAGTSMMPTLAEGDRLWAWRGTRRLKVGDIVVISTGELARRVGAALIVKRVVALGGDPVPERLLGARPEFHARARVPKGSLLVLGDGPVSFDSRNLGYIDRAQATAVVLRTVARRTAGIATDLAATPDPSGRQD